jgi:hypothetical protein
MAKKEFKSPKKEAVVIEQPKPKAVEQTKQPEQVKFDPLQDLRDDILSLAKKMREVGVTQPSPRRYIAHAQKLEALISRKIF